MGCKDFNVLHKQPGTAHNMPVCMPGTITNSTAQKYWDAYDSYNSCLKDGKKSAQECAPVVTKGYAEEVTIVSPRAMPSGLEAALCASAYP
jgi:hypothetical protein